MRLSAKDYIMGAQERIGAAGELYKNQRYVEAIYLSGVAVECTIRAYSTRAKVPFVGRHNLIEIAALELFVGTKKRGEISAALGVVWARWKNNYRYLGEDRLRSEQKKLGLDRGIKGDPLKENARQTLENALKVVNKGVYKWKTL